MLKDLVYPLRLLYDKQRMCASKNRKEVNCIREKQRISNDLRRYIYILKNEPESALDHGFTLQSAVRKAQSNKSGRDTKRVARIKIDDLPLK